MFTRTKSSEKLSRPGKRQERRNNEAQTKQKRSNGAALTESAALLFKRQQNFKVTEKQVLLRWMLNLEKSSRCDSSPG